MFSRTPSETVVGLSLSHSHTFTRQSALLLRHVIACSIHILRLYVSILNYTVKLYSDIAFRAHPLSGKNAVMIYHQRTRAWHSSTYKCCLRRCSCVREAGRKSWCAHLSFRWRCTTQTRKGATVQEAALTTVCLIRVSHPSISTACTATHRWDLRGWSHRNGYFGRSKQHCCFPEWWDQAELISLDVSISFLKILSIGYLECDACVDAGQILHCFYSFFSWRHCHVD